MFGQLLYRFKRKYNKVTWSEAYDIIKGKIKTIKPDKICGISGDLINMETLYIFKEFFNKSLKSNNLESRSGQVYLNPKKRENYLFNSSINGIEESDFIFLIGTNPRFEATILNSRIRKAYVQKKVKIISLNDVGDLTYPYQKLNGDTNIIKEIIEDKHEISKLIKEAKKPIVIIGQSALISQSGKYIFESIKFYLNKNNKILENWNSLNIISESASITGSFDLGIYKTSNGLNEVLIDLKNHNYEIVYLLGQDSLKFKKNNEFIIYQGSHGDNGAELADVILPGSAYTEQDGYFTNLEGKLQKAYKASYPPGEAKEDWLIINELSKIITNKKIFKNKEELDNSMLNYLNLFKKNNISKTYSEKLDLKFIDEKIKIKNLDYYYSNSIARSSKTMFQCRSEKNNLQSTVTEG